MGLKFVEERFIFLINYFSLRLFNWKRKTIVPFKFNKYILGFFVLFLINNYTCGIPIGATYALTQSKLTRRSKLING